MNTPRFFRRLILILVLALPLPAPLLAAGSACAPPPRAKHGKQSNLDELAEVVVTAKETSIYLNDLRAWLRRLVGQYSYEGYVDICGNDNPGDQRPVTGQADCIAKGSTPNIQCTVEMRWPVAVQENGEPAPGGAYSVVTAHVIYSIENRYIPAQRMNRWGLMAMQVDSKGKAEWASGALIGDSFVSNERCVGTSGDCQKMMRVTAKPNARELTMLVDIEVGKQRVMRQALVLHRESKSRSGEPSAKSAR